MKWRKVSDDHICHKWKCTGCKIEAEVDPSYYAESGIPFCISCEEDMEYQHTLVAEETEEKVQKTT